MHEEFRDKAAVVTGASSGIGRAVALALASAGARVYAFSRNLAALQKLVSAGPRIIPCKGDVADEASVQELFAKIGQDGFFCELLVNAAGIAEPRNAREMSAVDWDQTFRVNVRGTFLAIREALLQMEQQKRGSVVNVASISGVPGPEKFPGFVAYCASKGAVISMTEALAAEYRSTPIRFNCVSPGSVDTPMWSRVSGGAPAAMTADEVASAVLFLLSSRSRPMNGQNLDLYGA